MLLHIMLFFSLTNRDVAAPLVLCFLGHDQDLLMWGAPARMAWCRPPCRGRRSRFRLALLAWVISLATTPSGRPMTTSMHPCPLPNPLMTKTLPYSHATRPRVTWLQTGSASYFYTVGQSSHSSQDAGAVPRQPSSPLSQRAVGVNSAVTL